LLDERTRDEILSSLLIFDAPPAVALLRATTPGGEWATVKTF
jgi:hypothetical protein